MHGIFTGYEQYFGDTGILASVIPGYESRHGQKVMAEAVRRVLGVGNNFVVEAGTGTGKTLAYLIPLLDGIFNSNPVIPSTMLTGGDDQEPFDDDPESLDQGQLIRKGRIIVSTHTKILQNQLYYKDLPFLKQHVFPQLEYSIMLGSNNYVCRRRLKEFIPQEDQEQQAVLKVDEWARLSLLGHLEELDDHYTWMREFICREPDLCLKADCKFFRGCQYFHSKSKSENAHVVVVNHHLFFSDVATGGHILPPARVYVFDEGHTLEDTATSFFGFDISQFRINRILYDLYNPKRHRGILVDFAAEIEHVTKALDARKSDVAGLFREVKLFFECMDSLLPKNKTQSEVELGPAIATLVRAGIEVEIGLPPFFKRLKDIKDTIVRVIPTIPLTKAERIKELEQMNNRILTLIRQMDEFFSTRREDWIYWSDKNKRGYITLHATPIDVSQILRKEIFSMPYARSIVTSATLTTGGSFNFLQQRIGVDNSTVASIQSSFDYRQNVCLYIPQDLPDPASAQDWKERSAEEKIYQEATQERIKTLIEYAQGRTFVLFTSYAHLNKTYQYLKQALRGYVLLIQDGDTSPAELVKRFKQFDRAVLMGVATFWQGIDVPGEDLEQVIIAKLPFPQTDHPVDNAKVEKIKQSGLNSFKMFFLPRMLLAMKQGFGRLVRSDSDRGVVAILDKRAITKSYSEDLFTTLPPAGRTSSLEVVRRFLAMLISNRTKTKEDYNHQEDSLFKGTFTRSVQSQEPDTDMTDEEIQSRTSTVSIEDVISVFKETFSPPEDDEGLEEEEEEEGDDDFWNN